MTGIKKRLLLIEDDNVDQMAFRRFANTNEFEYDYDIAGSIEEAEILLNSNTYDVIVSDYFLGDGIAFDILENMKHIPMVITTGAGDEALAVKAMKLGAYDYFRNDNDLSTDLIVGTYVYEMYYQEWDGWKNTKHGTINLVR